MIILNNIIRKFIYWKNNKILLFKLKNFILRILIIYIKIPLIFLFNKKKIKSINCGFQDFKKHKDFIFVKKELIDRMIKFYHQNKITITEANNTSNKGVWREWIDINFEEIIDHIINKRTNKISDILNNMFREKIAIGAGGYDLWNRYNKIFGKYYINLVWNNYFELLKKSKFPIDKLKFPLIGNPCGLEFNNSIISIETLRHAYFAQKISNYINKESCKVVDIGPGIGGVMHQLLNLKNETKVFLVDLPEMIFFSSAFISTAFPNKNIFFYGESEKIRKNADIFFIPNTHKKFLNNYNIDIYFNSCSFSEMDSDETKSYLEIINKNCYGYLIHDNHEDNFKYKGTNNFSKNITGSKISHYLDRFQLLEKKKRTHMLPDDLNLEHFEYTLKKI